ncbi:MAG: serine hydrolase [Oscillospiraceae bacterium]|nr:serine hydrolase [Oscillospiraceae bacterium]
MYKKLTAVLTAAMLCLYPVNCAKTAATANGEGENKENQPTMYAALVEANTKTVLTSVNGGAVVSVGTMAKLMTVLLAAEAIEEGTLQLDDVKKTSARANSMQGAQIWLDIGEEMRISDLLKAVMIGNANDATVSLAEAAAEADAGVANGGEFTALMNAKARELGMVNTSFTNANGYDDSVRQLSTAEEMAVLLAELSRHEQLRDYFTCRMDYLRDGATQLVSSNILLPSYEGIIGFKAGSIENAGENEGYFVAAGARRDGETYTAFVLCDDKDLAFSEAKRLLNSGFTGYQLVKPDLPADLPSAIRVKGGVMSEMPLRVGVAGDIVIRNGTLGSVESMVILPEYIYAPVKRGGVIGEVRYYQDGNMLFSVNITAAEDTKRVNPLIAFGIILKFIFSF